MVEAAMSVPVDPVKPDPGTTYAPRKSWLPTNKVAVAALTALILFGLSRVTDVDKDLEQLVNVLVPLIVAYWIPNADSPGGVPLKR